MYLHLTLNFLSLIMKKFQSPSFFKKWTVLFLLTFILGFQNLFAETEKQNVLIILAHPNPESFNHAISKSIEERLVQEGHVVRVRDLYQLGFEPLLSLEEWKRYESQAGETPEDVKTEQAEIQWANHLILIYPTWWWSPPAMMKGYLDRIFTPVFAFEADVAGIRGKLQDKKVSIIQTTGAEESFIKENGMDESVRKLMGIGIFGFCGMQVANHQFLMGISGKSYEELKVVLTEVDAMVSEWF
jgi:NAD(P)H dehydrogenase (quinone)